MNEEVKRKIEEAALNACIVADSNGEPIQDQWAYDRFKAGAQFGYSLLSEENARLKEKFEMALSFIYENKGRATPTVTANKFIKKLRSYEQSKMRSMKKIKPKNIYREDLYAGLQDANDHDIDSCFMYIGARHYMDTAQIHLNRKEVKELHKYLTKVVAWMDTKETKRIDSNKGEA